MVTADQYINRLIEWVPGTEIESAVTAYEDILEHGFSPDEAFEMVIHL
jgi:hypothetical protein